MVRSVFLIGCLGLLLAGCTKSSDPGSAGPAPSAPTNLPANPGDNNAANAPTSSEGSAADNIPENMPANGGAGETFALSPENTRIQFVGNHTGDDPNPRTGHFEEFTGTLAWNSTAESPVSIQVEVATSSLTTDIGNLTNHLRSPDFFDVNEHPTLTFQSTSVEAGGEDQFQVSGNLTMLGNTREISFPVSVNLGSGEPKLSSEFSIQRSEFGMTYGLDRVEDEVFLTITVNGGVE